MRGPHAGYAGPCTDCSDRRHGLAMPRAVGSHVDDSGSTHVVGPSWKTPLTMGRRRGAKSWRRARGRLRAAPADAARARRRQEVPSGSRPCDRPGTIRRATDQWRVLGLETPLPMAALPDLPVQAPALASRIGVVLERSVVTVAASVDWKPRRRRPRVRPAAGRWSGAARPTCTASPEPGAVRACQLPQVIGSSTARRAVVKPTVRS